jgi:hypothetical protein
MEQDLYDKAARMILGSKTREELQTTRNFISLMEKNSNSSPLCMEAIKSLKEMWLKKDSEIFS